MSVGLKCLENYVLLLLNDCNMVYYSCSPYRNYSEHTFCFFHLLNTTKPPRIRSCSIRFDLIFWSYNCSFVKKSENSKSLFRIIKVIASVWRILSAFIHLENLKIAFRCRSPHPSIHLFAKYMLLMKAALSRHVLLVLL